MKKIMAVTILIALMLTIGSVFLTACEENDGNDGIADTEGNEEDVNPGDGENNADSGDDGDENEGEEGKILISFIGFGETHFVAEVVDGRFEMPDDPEKEGYLFEGWYLDENVWKEEFSQDTEVEQSVSVYAKWSVVAVYVKYDPEKSPSENGAVL